MKLSTAAAICVVQLAGISIPATIAIADLHVNDELFIKVYENGVHPHDPGHRPQGRPRPILYSDEDLFCLKQNVYFEARNQGVEGQAAVAHNTLNRLYDPDFPDTICGVTKQGARDGSGWAINRCQYSWYCDGKSDRVPVAQTPEELQAWETVQDTADRVLAGEIEDNTNGATHYHAAYVRPFWADVYTAVAVVEDHIFYQD